MTMLRIAVRNLRFGLRRRASTVAVLAVVSFALALLYAAVTSLPSAPAPPSPDLMLEGAPEGEPFDGVLVRGPRAVRVRVGAAPPPGPQAQASFHLAEDLIEDLQASIGSSLTLLYSDGTTPRALPGVLRGGFPAPAAPGLDRTTAIAAVLPIAILFLALAGVSLLTSQVLAVHGRRVELAVMSGLGFRRDEILRGLIYEAVAMSFLASALGVGAAAVVVNLALSGPLTPEILGIRIPLVVDMRFGGPDILLLVPVIGLVTGVFGIPPAVHGAGLPFTRLLRQG